MRLLPLLLLTACQPDADDRPDTEEPLDTGETGAPCAPIDEALLEPIRAAVREDLDANYASGASVAIWRGGCVAWAQGFGSRHPDKADPVTPDTLFQIGSDTKKIAAIALLRQVEAGRLGLDDTLTEAIPDLTFALDPTWGDGRTLRQLLTHTSGLFDYTPWSHHPEDSELHDIAVGRFAENEYAMNPAGEFWNYANPNFSLVGLATEEADGRAWPDIVEDDVFAPLGMDRSIARLADVAADDDYATGTGVSFRGGYDTFDVFEMFDADYDWGTVEMEDQVDNAFTRPAGLVWSTASDMARLAAFLVDGDEAVLAEASRALISTPAVPLYEVAPDFGSYGMGLMVSDGFTLANGWYEVPLWSHGGNTMCMTSTFYVLPTQGLALSVLSNGYGDDFSGTAVAAFTALADLPTPSDAPAFPPPDDPAGYAGTWYDPWALGTLALTWDGARLLADAPDLAAMGIDVEEEVELVYQHLLLLTVADAQFVLQVVDGDDGTPHGYLANRSFVLTAVDDAGLRRPPPTRTAAVLRQARLLGPAPRPPMLAAPYRFPNGR